MPGIALLDNPVQDYAWGSKTFIARLLGKGAPSERPQAELWMGAHPQGTSRVFWGDRWLPLSDIIQKDPSGILGPSVSVRFSNRLPFLFKVLAASKPLSIQAHPNREQAFRGFGEENKRGIPLTAPHRNYRDDCHKPEILCALTGFWALKGFRTAEEIRLLFGRAGIGSADLPELDPEHKGGVKSLFRALLTMAGEKQRQFVSRVVSAARAQGPSDPVADWVVKLQEAFPYDMGVVAPVLLNLIRLEPGEALPVQAGELHCYLDGAGIEVMANSDNVLRGGLTEKHVDLSELLKILTFSPCENTILHPEARGNAEWCYAGGAEEFLLSRITLQPGVTYQSPKSRSVEIVMCVEGEMDLADTAAETRLRLRRGSSALIPALVAAYRVTGSGTLYKASVPT